MANPPYAPLVLVLLGALAAVGYMTGGLAPAAIVLLPGVPAFLAWLRTTYRNPPEPPRLLIPYALLVGTEALHMAEEYATGFPGQFSRLLGIPFPEPLFVTLILTALGVWTLGLAALAVRNPLGYYAAWYVAIGPGLANGVAHLVFPVAAGSLYFPGLATVALPTAASILLIRRMVPSPAAAAA